MSHCSNSYVICKNKFGNHMQYVTKNLIRKTYYILEQWLIASEMSHMRYDSSHSREHTHTHTHTHKHTHTFRMHIICKYVCLISEWDESLLCVCMCMCVYVCVNIYVLSASEMSHCCVCVCVCVCMCVYATRTHTHTHIHTRVIWVIARRCTYVWIWVIPQSPRH